MDELKFNLKLKEVPVCIVDIDCNEKQYTLRELAGDERNTWLNSMRKRIQIGPGGKVASITNFKGLQESLLSICLLDEERQPVSEEKLNKWPGGVLTALFLKAQELSGLDMKGVENVMKMNRKDLLEFIKNQELGIDPDNYETLKDLKKAVADEIDEDEPKN